MEEPYGTAPGTPTAEVSEQRLMMAPGRPAAFMWAAAACAQKKAPLEVGPADDTVPQALVDLEGGADLLDARIVDQDVHPAQPGERVFHRAAAARDRGHVVNDRLHTTSGAGEAFLGFGQGPQAARRHGDIGPRSGQSLGDRLPDAAAGAGDECDAPAEVEGRRVRHRFSTSGPGAQVQVPFEHATPRPISNGAGRSSSPA